MIPIKIRLKDVFFFFCVSKAPDFYEYYIKMYIYVIIVQTKRELRQLQIRSVTSVIFYIILREKDRSHLRLYCVFVHI